MADTIIVNIKDKFVELTREEDNALKGGDTDSPTYKSAIAKIKAAGG